MYNYIQKKLNLWRFNFNGRKHQSWLSSGGFALSDFINFWYDERQHAQNLSNCYFAVLIVVFLFRKNFEKNKTNKNSNFFLYWKKNAESQIQTNLKPWSNHIVQTISPQTVVISYFIKTFCKVLRKKKIKNIEHLLIFLLKQKKMLNLKSNQTPDHEVIKLSVLIPPQTIVISYFIIKVLPVISNLSA